MKICFLDKTRISVAALIALAAAPLAAHAQLAIQRPCDVLGTGTNARPYLILEAENYISESDNDPDNGFVKVYNDEAITSSIGNPVLGTNSAASKKGALFAKGPLFGLHADKITYQVQFSTPGTYYLYMRFTMFDNAGGNGNYLSEDSFFVPPDFNKDPQTDWPLTDPANGRNGGYTEGCCGNSGFLYIIDYQGDGSRTAQTTDTNYWEGNFHWNQLLSSQFLTPGLSGEPNTPHKYEVTPAMVGKVLNFTISFREAGVTPDLWLFSTHTNLLNDYTQAELDQLVNKVTVQDPNDAVNTGTNVWRFLRLEAEDYAFETNRALDAGWVTAGATDALTNSLGNPVLGTNTTASKKGALYAQSPLFGLHADKVTYWVQFSNPGTYYLYMRFTMYDNAGGNGNYLSEDSFFVPPDFNKDPQTDWPLTDPANGRNGGYTEGCCGNSGFLYIIDYQGDGSRTAQTTDTNYWEGKFHWNQLLSSQFLTPGLSGEPNTPHKYEVTPSMVGTQLSFTVSYREAGVTPDLWLFSTHTNLLNDYTQEQLDALLLTPRLAIRRSGTNVVISWPTSACDYTLESSPSLSPANWSAVETPAAGVGSRIVLTLTAEAGSRFYRLRQR